ncbi:PQQ-binding-like beta-propeller repeat protein [candidate division KSB1 bacterium]|nr:PQQ-binding-like beta-propeller repeat protein [candidate division KSB1 bacterium]
MHTKSTRFIQLIVLLATSLFILNSTLFAQPAVLWKSGVVSGEYDSSPAIGDVDGDGITDIIAVSTKGDIVAMDLNGNTIWRIETGELISNPPTLADVTGTKGFEVLVICESGKLFCIDASNAQNIWTYKLPGGVSYGITAVPAVDLNSDGRLEILAADNQGHLVCLSGAGKPLWTYTDAAEINSAPAVADLDGDGTYEIVYSSRANPLVCVSNKGKRLWRLNVPFPDKPPSSRFAGTSPLIIDLDGNGVPEILVAIREKISAVSAKGTLLWQYPLKTDIHDGFSAGDIDGDGNAEVVVADLQGYVACLSSKGEEKWTAKVNDRVRRSPTMGDIDGDGVAEILIAGYSGGIDVFEPDGALLQHVPVFKDINTSPAIVDFSGDGRLVVICAAEHNVRALTWMEEPPEIAPVVLFPEYRCNSTRTGSFLKPVEKKGARITGVDYGDLFAGTNLFCACVHNPNQETLTLRINVKDNSQTIGEITQTSRDDSFKAELSYWLFETHPAELHFSCTLSNKKQVISREEHQVHFEPFANEINHLGSTLEEIAFYSDEESLPPQFEGHLIALHSDLEHFKQQVNQASVFSAIERRELRAKFRKDIADADRILKLMQIKTSSASPLIISTANPWASFGDMDEITESRVTQDPLSIEAFQDEVESAALNLFNLREAPMVLRVEPGTAYSEDSASTASPKTFLSFREALMVPTEMMNLSADALPALGQAGTLIIPGWHGRQLWISVNTAALTPGNWTVPIRLRSLDLESEEQTVTLTIRVWDSKLPTEQPLRLCHWGYVQSSILKDIPEAALKDQVSHGTNVFVATNEYAPAARFNEAGELVGSIDFAAHDDYMRRHAPHGIVLFFSYQGKLSGPAEHFTQPWKKAYQSWIQAWAEHLLEMGIGYSGWALYPIDEPGLYDGLIEKYVGYAKPVREINPQIQMYTDPVLGAKMAAVKQLAPYVDIWCPNRNSFLIDKNTEEFAFIKSTGKTIWTYECEGNAKHQSPLGYYRAQAWLAKYRGITGIGFWSYCTSRDDPWYVPEGGKDYLLIYQGDGVVPSKRWEAIRDGIEDFSMLRQLEAGIQAAALEPGKKAAVQRAQQLLRDDVREIASFCGLDKDGNIPGARELTQHRVIADKRWHKIIYVRRKLAELLAALGGD